MPEVTINHLPPTATVAGFGSLRIVISSLFDGRYVNVFACVMCGGYECHMCVCGCPENKVPFICFIVGIIRAL